MVVGLDEVEDGLDGRVEDLAQEHEDDGEHERRPLLDREPEGGRGDEHAAGRHEVEPHVRLVADHPADAAGGVPERGQAQAAGVLHQPGSTLRVITHKI